MSKRDFKSARETLKPFAPSGTLRLTSGYSSPGLVTRLKLELSSEIFKRQESTSSKVTISPPNLLMISNRSFAGVWIDPSSEAKITSFPFSSSLSWWILEEIEPSEVMTSNASWETTNKKFMYWLSAVLPGMAWAANVNIFRNSARFIVSFISNCPFNLYRDIISYFY